MVNQAESINRQMSSNPRNRGLSGEIGRDEVAYQRLAVFPQCWCAILALLLVLITSSPVLAAQSITAHGDISLTATLADYDAGEILSEENVISWTTDVEWIITICSLDADLGQSDDASYTKPLSDLKWKLSALSSWNTMTQTEETFYQGSSTGSKWTRVDYKFLLSWALDKPGTYGATLRYTISPR